jgi:predicted CoA-substrate-specific enzyme activase
MCRKLAVFLPRGTTNRLLDGLSAAPTGGNVRLGIDIGSVSLKAVLVGSAEEHELVTRVGERLGGGIYSAQSLVIAPLEPLRLRGKPVQTATELLDRLAARTADMGPLPTPQVTGSGAPLLADALRVPVVNDFKALALGIRALEPDVRTVLEMGGELSRYMRLGDEPGAILDYQTNGDCAAGTGAFLDQQASRLQVPIDRVGDVARSAPRAARIAGRCSVFAKSDMIHAQQKGYQPAEVLKGLCDAVARNFKAAVAKGKQLPPTVAFVGGVSLNAAVVEALERAFEMSPGSLRTPTLGRWAAALGAALCGASGAQWSRPRSDEDKVEAGFPSSPPLSMDNVVLLRDRVSPYAMPAEGDLIPAYLGIDVGSVSTNLALVDEQGRVIRDVYLRTRARPIEVVAEGLEMIEGAVGARVDVRGVGTTGSGRELIGQLVGADTVNDEITAHKTGAVFVAERYLGQDVDTIFEIGGQDSKFISIEDGVVVDFAMNEACAAGTGSFLEERAEELGVPIENEFARLALESEAPIRLGERCTVFMEQDVNSYQQRGAATRDLVAGLAYSVAYNYINRVVRGRRIGSSVFFQGGTAYNDSVAAAFSRILDKTIVVPPHNGVIGAIGAALLAREKVEARGGPTSFRGYDISRIDYSLREFTCQGCTNYCDIQEFTVENEKTYWGDKCSERYRKRARVERSPVLDDLVALREHELCRCTAAQPARGPTVGIPRCLFLYDQLPFWQTYLRVLGARTVMSPPTNRALSQAGIEISVAEPCYPVRVAHGHIQFLLERVGVDLVLVPNVIDVESPFPQLNSHLCPWAQTLPWVVRSAPRVQRYADRLLSPTLRFRLGRTSVAEALEGVVARLGADSSRSEEAVSAAYEAQERFTAWRAERGSEALLRLQETGEPAVLLLGRSYNAADRTLNLNVPSKIRHTYGVDVLPVDFLPIEDVDVSDINDSMYWSYGRRILAAAKFAADRPYLHIVYLTNFKCGPDSYIKHYVRTASGRPFLSLQFDEHSNDAGIMTRCEAYLDSKGILRWWARRPRSDTPHPVDANRLAVSAPGR